FEAFLREFPTAPPDEKGVVEKAVADLRGLVGTLDVRQAEPGATVVVDGRTRGTVPLAGPLRVSSGTRMVRVYKEGYSPFETRVDVAGGQNAVVVAKLGALTQ